MDILLIEDDDIDVEILERTLKKLKIQHILTRVKDGEEALEILKQLRPKIILLDLNLPKINGLDFLSQIKKSLFKKIPVVVLTTSCDQEDIQKAYEGGISGYFTKTFDSQEFEKKINALFNYWNFCEV